MDYLRYGLFTIWIIYDMDYLQYGLFPIWITYGLFTVWITYGLLLSSSQEYVLPKKLLSGRYIILVILVLAVHYIIVLSF